VSATIERLIASTPQGPMLAGLLWRAPSAGRSRARALQEAKSLTADATHYAVAEVNGQLRYGMYQARASEESVALPKLAQSAAACFALRVGAQAPNAALVLTVPAAGQRKEDKYFVVCLEDGVPAVDVLSNEVEARNALGAEDRPIWSDNPVAYPNSAAADFEWLATAAGKSTRLQSIPLNPWPLVGIGVALAVVAGGWGWMQHARRAEEARQALEAARAADPVPRYLAALQSRRPAMAADRQAMVAAVDALFLLRTWVPGWQLATADCVAASQTCADEWVRKGGTWDDLRRHWPQARLELVQAPGGAAPLLDRARLTHPVAIPRVDLVAAAAPLLTLPQAFAAAGPQWQVWRTADLPLEFKKPTLWPRLSEVPASFQHPSAVLAGDVELRNVPGPFILEALRTAPKFISWEAVHLDVNEGSDARLALKFSASGVFYVASR